VILAAVLLAAVATAPAGGRVVETLLAERVLPDGRFDGFARWTAPGRPSVALALSGGGARGIAHIGVAEAMQEDGVEFDAIAGTSMGALIGGFLAAGYRPEEIRTALERRDWNAIVSPLDQRRRVLSEVEDTRRAAALVSYRRVPGSPAQIGALVETRVLDRELNRYLLAAQLVCEGDFDRLRYRFRAISTDIVTGRAVIPDSGDLVTAIRGSFAIPGVFRPVRLGDARLVDGGLVENLPTGTARAFGTDAVLAVDVSERVVARPMRGTFDALNRSITILTAAQQEASRNLADVTVLPEVVDASQADFRESVAPLVDVGRAGYASMRDAVWAALESKAKDPSKLAWDTIEVEGTDWIDATALARRLGGSPGSATRFRIRSELARVLNLGPVVDGRAEIVEGASGRVLRFVFVPAAVLRTVTQTGPDIPPPEQLGITVPLGQAFSLETGRRLAGLAHQALVEQGRVFLFVGLASWRNESGELDVDLRELPTGTIDVEVDGPVDLAPAQRHFRDLQGRSFRFDSFAERLEELVVRGVIEDWTVEPRLTAEGTVDFTLHLRGENFWEGAGGVSWRDAYSWAGFASVARGNLRSRGDRAELAAFGAKELQGASLRYRSEFLGKFRNLGFEAGFLFAESQAPVVDDRQRIIDGAWEEGRTRQVWVHLLRRLRFGIAGRLGIDHVEDRVFEGATGPELRRDRTIARLQLGLDRHDRLVFPTTGGAAHLSIESTLGGTTLNRIELTGDKVVAFGEERFVTFTLRGGVGTSRGADRRVDWFDPGGYRSLYGFIPYGASAPHYARLGLVARLRSVEIGPLGVYLEAGTDAVRGAAVRDDLGDAPTRVGYGASATAFLRGVGPITLGYARNDEGAQELFLTLGYDFLRR
jgi:predicted acylesterase/phospholipase RssA